jgi:hypothetical protein
MLGKLLPYPNPIQLGTRQPNNTMKFNHLRKKEVNHGLDEVT